ncbi:MAG: GIY-YIG nuclease family protein [Actinomycetota bacterium]|nr:GIY-YIG nuclease family protein [Actinomycetota bacterium]
MSSIDEIVQALSRPPKSLREVQARDGIPAQPGLYAWWTKRGSIPSVPGCPHPTEGELDLFYVGISPSRGTSSATLRSRVTGNHIGGNTGSSTFRQTLASLLSEEKGWKPVRVDRPLLTPEDNKALTDWQHEHLRLTWATHPEPWSIEHQVIGRLQPPLNLMGNRSHPFAATVSAARKRFKDAAAANQKEI